MEYVIKFSLTLVGLSNERAGHIQNVLFLVLCFASLLNGINFKKVSTLQPLLRENLKTLSKVSFTFSLRIVTKCFSTF